MRTILKQKQKISGQEVPCRSRTCVFLICKDILHRALSTLL